MRPIGLVPVIFLLLLAPSPANGLDGGSSMLMVSDAAVGHWTGVASGTAPGGSWGACAGIPAQCFCYSVCEEDAAGVARAATASPSAVVTLHTKGDFGVRHAWTLGATPDTYEAEVTLINLAARPLPEVHYRWALAIWLGADQHAMDSRWNVSELVPFLRYSGTLGLVDATPSSPYFPPSWANVTTCPAPEGPGSLSGGTFYNLTRLTPCAGMMADFDAGTLAAGASKSFTITLGYGATLADAAALAGASDLGFWSWSTSSPGARVPYVLFDRVAAFADGTPLHAVSADLDRDGVNDDSDNCPQLPNDQADWDRDGQGDACDPDAPPAAPPAWLPSAWLLPARDGDRDGIVDEADVCPRVPDAAQLDLDLDGQGDACDPDLDGDGVAQEPAPFPDNCPTTPNPLQQDRDGDAVGDACDPAPDAPPAAAASAPLRPAAGVTRAEPANLPLPLAVLVLAAGGLVLLLAAQRRWLALGLFTRLRPDRLLDHPVRLALLEAAEARPGQSTSSLARTAGVSRNAAEHHLRRLAKAGLLQVHKGRGGAWVFPAAAPLCADPLGGEALRLARLVGEHPGATVPELARLSGLSYSAAYHRVRHLAQAGRMVLRRDAGLRVFLADPDAP